MIPYAYYYMLGLKCNTRFVPVFPPEKRFGFRCSCFNASYIFWLMFPLTSSLLISVHWS